MLTNYQNHYSFLNLPYLDNNFNLFFLSLQKSIIVKINLKQILIFKHNL